MIYMFILIRMGKDSKDRDKDWILCVYNINTKGDIIKENGSIFSLWFLLKCSPPCYFYNKVTYIKSDFILTDPLSILFFLCSQSIYYLKLNRHQASSLLSTVHCAVTQILLFFIFSSCSHSKSWSQHQICDTSFFLFEFYIGIGSVCFQLCYCNC